MVSVDKLRYKIIPNFLNKTEIDLLKRYCKLQHFNNRTSFDLVQNNNADTYFTRGSISMFFKFSAVSITSPKSISFV